MPVTPPVPLLKRVPPGVWTALAWCAGTAYAFLVLVRLPGQLGPFPEDMSRFLLAPPNMVMLGVSAALALGGSLLLRRSPLGGIALLLAAAVYGAMAMNSSEINIFQFLPVDVALCFVASIRPRRASVPALLLAFGVLVGFVATRLLIGFVIGTSALLAVALTVLVSWLTGHTGYQSRRHAEQLAATAAARAVTDERLRIARELHDMVAHSVGIVALQAGAAGRVIGTQPNRAREALAAVESTSRETLAGLRRMLGALRETAPLGPLPGLADVERLAATTTAAGVRVDLVRNGERRALPAEVELAAYRIVQESVANVVRHAGTTNCSVTLEQRDGELAIEVLDAGRGLDGGPGAGYGLLGMRERVALLHGDFSAQPRPGGGFRVAARLPLPEPYGPVATGAVPVAAR